MTGRHTSTPTPGPFPTIIAKLRRFLPPPAGIDGHEKVRLCIGAWIGILATGLLSYWLTRLQGSSPGGLPGPWMAAPLGASAVLIFATPSSPMSQPWPVIGGNTLSAFAGIAVVQAIAGLHMPWLESAAAAMAVTAAIALMLLTRCLHPPGGATALLVVLNGISDARFALTPMLLNSILMVCVGVIYNRQTGRSYPHPQQSVSVRSKDSNEGGIQADIEAALHDYNQILDISKDDLQTLAADVRKRAGERKLREVLCEDIMSSEPVAVEFGTSLQDAWSLLRTHRIKALPVVDRRRQICGIVTLADFMRAADLDVHRGFDTRLKAFIRTTPTSHSAKPDVVGQIMTRNVRVAGRKRPLAQLLPLFAGTGHHHIPIIDDDLRLVGMITQTDLVTELGAQTSPVVPPTV